MESSINNNTYQIEIGTQVFYNSITYKITHIIDQKTVIARRYDTGTSEKLNISELTIVTEKDQEQDELLSVPDYMWDAARERFEVIKPLLKMNRRTKKDVEARAKIKNVHSATVYRWIKVYESTGKLSSLLHIKKRGGKGRSRLGIETDNVIRDVLENFYLKPDRPSIANTYREIITKCKELNIKIPSENSLRNRITRLNDKTKMYRRISPKQAMESFGPYPSKFPDADYPLSVVQIDHTPLDIIIVDEENRQSIGRPWITLAIDVYSRAVTGFYLSLEKPASISVGLCIINSVLTKESRIAELNLDCSWSIMGIPGIIHVDNAKEFDGKMLERACREYNIDIHLRPVARPNYGAHIERFLGTLNKEIHDLPGTTYSNISQRANYKSEDKAVFTLVELEKWITLLIADVYHKKIHSETKQMPYERFKDGLIGDDIKPGIGLPKLPYKTDKFKLDFMPFIKRTIQQHGIKFNRINYYHDVLKAWINAKDPDQNKYKRAFIIRYDPRDISKVYFYDPELLRYYEIPYRNMSAPRMTIWELKEVQKSLVSEGLENYDEESIFLAYRKLKDIENKSTKKTKSIRRKASRKLNAELSTQGIKSKTKPTESLKPNFGDDDLEPFEDIQTS